MAFHREYHRPPAERVRLPLKPAVPLDLSAGDVVRGLALCAAPPPRPDAVRRLSERWPTPDQVLPVHSLQGGLDLALRGLGLPPGTPVGVTAIARWEVVDQLARHGLEAIPIDIDPDTLAPRPAELRQVLQQGLGALIVTHLWGSRVPLAPVAREARSRGIPILEDATHAFRDPRDDGSAGATVSLFGFGPGATPTALGGGVAVVRDAALLQRMRRLCGGYPVEPGSVFAGELAVAAARLLAEEPALYGIARRALGGLIHDDAEAVAALHPPLPPWRLLPSAPRLAFLAGRLGRVDPLTARRRGAAGAWLARRMPRVLVAGRRALGHTWSRVAVVCPDPRKLRARLEQEGFESAILLGPYALATRGGLAPARAAALMAGAIGIHPDSSMSMEDLGRLAHAIEGAAGIRA